MRKLLSVLISIEMFFLSIGIQAFAATNHINSYNNSELDLSQYTLEDIGNMSAVEFRKLLADFERVYDPFDTYETDPIMAENTTSVTEEDIGNTASPQWGSGEIDKDGNHTEVGSHEMITARACVILTSDKGFFSSSAAESVAIALTISIASLLPDKDSSSHADAFAGHFYDPTTEKIGKAKLIIQQKLMHMKISYWQYKRWKIIISLLHMNILDAHFTICKMRVNLNMLLISHGHLYPQVHTVHLKIMLMRI